MKHRCYLDTPVGVVCIEENGEAVTALYFDRKDKAQPPEPETALLLEAERQLREYFEGKRKEFALPLSPKGTEFQQKVWKALCAIPYGETRSYGQIAAQIGQPKAGRAVGGANNKNPIMIFIPCHRVIGADGSLTGFGGGFEAKKYLLELETGKELSVGKNEGKLWNAKLI